MPSPLETSLAQLAVYQKADGPLTAVVAAANIWPKPPMTVAATPAIVNLVEDGAWSTNQDDEHIPSGHQGETDTILVAILSSKKNRAEAQNEVLPALDALRVLLNSHKTVNGTCRNSYVRRWKFGPLEYGGEQFFALMVWWEVLFDLAGNFAA